MEELITFIVIIILSALSNWWAKRNEEKQGEHADQLWEEAEHSSVERQREAPSPAEPPPLRPRARSWEDQLRRLLEVEQEGKEVQVPSPQPAPPVRPARPVPPVQKAGSSQPVVTGQDALKSKKAAMAPTEVAREAKERFQSAQRGLSNKARALTSNFGALHEQVANLRQQVAVRREGVRTELQGQLKGQIEVQPVVPLGPVSAEVVGALKMVRHPSGARQAFILSTILSAPKAMENSGE